MVLCPSQLQQTATAKPCKGHGVLKHDIFTLYRTKVDSDFVTQLVPFLEKLASQLDFL
ncbi:hypothetical protein HK100_009728, partial [Physocladia obscura]